MPHSILIAGRRTGNPGENWPRPHRRRVRIRRIRRFRRRVPSLLEQRPVGSEAARWTYRWHRRPRNAGAHASERKRSESRDDFRPCQHRNGGASHETWRVRFYREASLARKKSSSSSKTPLKSSASSRRTGFSANNSAGKPRCLVIASPSALCASRLPLRLRRAAACYFTVKAEQGRNWWREPFTPRACAATELSSKSIVPRFPRSSSSPNFLDT